MKLYVEFIEKRDYPILFIEGRYWEMGSFFNLRYCVMCNC